MLLSIPRLDSSLTVQPSSFIRSDSYYSPRMIAAYAARRKTMNFDEEELLKLIKEHPKFAVGVLCEMHKHYQDISNWKVEDGLDMMRDRIAKDAKAD
jgi:hypothetical protein